MRLTRRAFTASAAASWLAAAPPSDRLHLGLIGAGGRGTHVMRVFQEDANVSVEGVCDVCQPNLERGLSTAAGAQGGRQPKAYRNYRQLLDDKSIQAVLIASPEHWHHRMVLDALAAGKDVYVEKPLCQTPEQGVELVEAERRSNNIIQTGMQRFSSDPCLGARQVIAAGTLGSVRMVRSWWLNRLAPATAGAGTLAGQGAYLFDALHLLLNEDYPLSVVAAANRPHEPGAGTPESVVVTAEFPGDFTGVFSINHGAMRGKGGHDRVHHFDGDEARLDIGSDGFKVFPLRGGDKPSIIETSPAGFESATALHVRNFLECVRSRNRPAAPARLAFQACLVTQMADLSLRHGRRMRWDGEARRVVAG